MRRSYLIGGSIVGVIVICVIIAIATRQNDPKEVNSYITSCTNPHKTSDLGTYKSAAISTDASPCGQFAKDVLQRNGTAADATVAAMFCVGVINAQSCGLGGGFVATYYAKSENKVYTLDAREVAPVLAYEDMYNPTTNHSKDAHRRLSDYFEKRGLEWIKPLNDANSRWWEKLKTRRRKGGLSVAVPGESAGLFELYTKFGGNIPWSELIEPTIKLCEEGYDLTWYTGGILEMSAGLLLSEPSMSLFTKKEETRGLREGETVYRKKLATTLRALQKDPRALVEGPLAKMLVEDIQSFDGLIVEEDLKNYKPVWREPAEVHLKNGNFTLYSFPPPGGGPLVGLILNILDEFKLDHSSLEPNQLDKTLQIFTEAMKFGFGRRYKLGDLSPEEAKKVMAEFSSDQLALEIKKNISLLETSSDPLFYGAKLSNMDDHGTAHLSLVSQNGDAISLTSSVNYGFGAGIRSEQTGIILNNQMADFNTLESLEGSDKIMMGNNLIKPGKRPLSSMSPTIVLNADGNARLVIGGAGGTMIPTAIAWTAARNLWMDEDIKQAIDGCRLHHQLQPMVLRYENGFPEEQLEKLQQKKHTTEQSPYKSTVEAIALSSSGFLEANADYRKSGEIAGF